MTCNLEIKINTIIIQKDFIVSIYIKKKIIYIRPWYMRYIVPQVKVNYITNNQINPISYLSFTQVKKKSNTDNLYYITFYYYKC